MTHESVDGEVVIVNLESGAYYSVAGMGAYLWEAIAAGASREHLLAAVAHTYPVEPDAVVLTGAFLNELVAERLVLEKDRPSDPPPECLLPERWAAPHFEKFTDMQEILLLDPIHEVGATGWPHKP